MREVLITREDIRGYLAEAVRQNESAVRPAESQAALDRAAAACLADGEDVVGMAVVLLQALRVAGRHELALARLFELAVELHGSGGLDAALFRLAAEHPG